MHETNNSGNTRASTGTGSFGLILVLLLMALLAFSFWYTGPDGRTYGDAALQDAQEFTEKVMRRAKRVYRCATQGCKEVASQAAVAPVPVSEPEASVTAQTATPAAVTEPTTPIAAVTASAATAVSTPVPTTSDTPSPPVFRTNPILPPGVLSNTQAATMPAQTAGSGQVPLAPEPATPVPPLQNLHEPARPALPFTAPQAPVPAASPVAPPTTERTFQPAPKQLLAARRALQERRYQDAVSLYRKQISNNPEDIDAYGELGNTLLLVHRYQESAQSYYEAATRLLDAGLSDSAMPLLPVIEQYEPLLANLLKQKAARLGR